MDGVISNGRRERNKFGRCVTCARTRSTFLPYNRGTKGAVATLYISAIALALWPLQTVTRSSSKVTHQHRARGRAWGRGYVTGESSPLLLVTGSSAPISCCPDCDYKELAISGITTDYRDPILSLPDVTGSAMMCCRKSRVGEGKFIMTYAAKCVYNFSERIIMYVYLGGWEFANPHTDRSKRRMAFHCAVRT